ncbi:MAG: efflux RND transporter periplasmic adaptor subunit [Persicimonas sp.]
MKRRYIRLFVLAVAVVAVGWLTFAKISDSSSSESEGEGGPPGGGGEAQLVTTHTVEPSTLYDSLAAIGTLEADESIMVRNETPGKIVSIDFEEGERVSKGQRLMQMRNDTLQAELRVQERRRDLLETELERQKQVLDQGGVSQHEYDVTANELEIAKAQVDRTRAQLEETVVRAPFDGVVGLRDVSPGAVVTDGADVAELRKTDKLALQFSVPERFAPRIEEGMEVYFRTHGSEKIHDAEVTNMEPGLDSKDRTLLVEATVDNEDDRFRPGSFAQVRLVLERLDNVLAVPPAAELKSSEGSQVWVLEDGEAKRRDIRAGFRDKKRLEVTDGLSEGDEVIVTGRDKLEDGAPVEVDDSEGAIDVDDLEPDSATQGMRNQRFSGAELEEALLREAQRPPGQPEDGDGADEQESDEAAPDDEEAQ